MVFLPPTPIPVGIFDVLASQQQADTVTEPRKLLLETDTQQLQALGWNEHFQTQVDDLRNAEDPPAPSLVARVVGVERTG